MQVLECVQYNSSPCPLHQNDEKQVEASRLNVAGRNWSWDSRGIQQYQKQQECSLTNWRHNYDALYWIHFSASGSRNQTTSQLKTPRNIPKPKCSICMIEIDWGCCKSSLAEWNDLSQVFEQRHTSYCANKTSWLRTWMTLHPPQFINRRTRFSLLTWVCLHMWHHQNPFIKIRQRHQSVMHLYGPWFWETHKHGLYHFTCIQVR